MLWLGGLGGVKPVYGSNCWKMSRGQMWLLMDRVCLIGVGGMRFVRDGKGGGVAGEAKSSVKVNFN